MKDVTTSNDGSIVVEVRLSDEALALRIINWINGNAAFILGAAGGVSSAIIADHIPDDAEAPVVLLGEEDSSSWPNDSRVAARLNSSVDLVKLRIAVEAAAHGFSISNPSRTGAPNGNRPKLTGRETEILQLLAEGASNKAIARALDITSHTVKFHVASIFAKLGASSRTEAVTSAIRLGLLMV